YCSSMNSSPEVNGEITLELSHRARRRDAALREEAGPRFVSLPPHRLVSLPLRGRAGVGVGFPQSAPSWNSSPSNPVRTETHPHPTRPARRSAPVVRSVRAAEPPSPRPPSPP